MSRIPGFVRRRARQEAFAREAETYYGVRTESRDEAKCARCGERRGDHFALAECLDGRGNFVEPKVEEAELERAQR